MPVLLADETARQQTVAVTGHELGPALGTRKTLEVKYMMTAGRLLLRGILCTSGPWPAPGPHHKLAGGDRLSTRRAGPRVTKQPETQIKDY